MTFNLYNFKTGIRRALVKAFRLNRPTGYPYLTGDGFRAFGDHFFDEASTFDPAQVQDRDIVYVRGDFLHTFFTKKHPLIRYPYILISNSGDLNIDAGFETYIDEKIIHWFAQNLFFAHSKVTPIPIGLTNIFTNHIGTMSEFRSAITRAKRVTKKTGLSHGFSLISHPERLPINNLLRSHPLSHEISRVKQPLFFDETASYKFCASPEGHGADCHRTWEAMYLGVVPIVKESPFTTYFKSLGLPLLLVSNWDEVKNFDQKFLDETYEKLKKDFENPALQIEYWMHKILDMRSI